MSRCATPASHSFLMSSSPLVDDVVIDVRGADLDCAGEVLGDEEVPAPA
jgi:hypothetical protein